MVYRYFSGDAFPPGGIAELWQELGISAGTAIVVLITLYFVIKWA